MKIFEIIEQIINPIFTFLAILVPLIAAYIDFHKIEYKKSFIKEYFIFQVKFLFCIIFLVYSFYLILLILSINSTNTRLFLDFMIIFIIILFLIMIKSDIPLSNLKKKFAVYEWSSWVKAILVAPGLALGGALLVILNKPEYSFWAVLILFFMSICSFGLISYKSKHDYYSFVHIAFDDGDIYKIVLSKKIHIHSKWVVFDEKNGYKERYLIDKVKMLKDTKRDLILEPNNHFLTERIPFAIILSAYMVLLCSIFQIVFQPALGAFVISDSSIQLHPGDYYQIDAVSLSKDAGQLQYRSTNDSDISISENGIVHVNNDLDENKTITVIVSDRLGNAESIIVYINTSS